MSGTDFDVVVVGARCAGASLATFLARSGARVLVVDRDRLPSDQVLSTHTIHPPGMDVLDELGVGEAVREVAPAGLRVRLVKGEACVDASFEGGRAEHCPRRERLDGLLQDAAVAAGAELRDRTRVTEVLVEGDRVRGVRLGSGKGGGDVRCDLVVGADGRRSTVARQVRAEEYLAYDMPRAMFWAYWDTPPLWRSPDYPFDVYLGYRDGDLRVVFQTDHDQLLIGSVPPVAEALTWRDDPLAALLANLAGDPVTGRLVEGAEPDGKVRGTVKERCFFRRAVGPGWALVGDAGHHKDFVIGDGITEALLQAKNLAAAVQEDGDEALVRWWRRRDVRALPAYFWGKEEGTPAPPAVLEQLIFSRLGSDPELARLPSLLPEHRCSPYELVPASLALRCLLRGVLGGRLQVIPEFLAHGRRGSEYRRELRLRRQLLETMAA